MSDFTILKKELKKSLDNTKTVQVIKLDNTEYMLGLVKNGKRLVTTSIDNEEFFVCYL